MTTTIVDGFEFTIHEADEHSHECRDCRAEIPCCFTEAECYWPGGNEGCDCGDPARRTVEPLACSECGQVGTYSAGWDAVEADVVCNAADCTHTANRVDFDLDPGEVLAWVDGVLHVSRPA